MATEQVAEQVAEHIEEVADGLEEVAQVTRNVNPTVIRYFAGGIAVGFVFGFVLGYRWNKEKIKAEAFTESEREIKAAREAYQELSANLRKPDLEEVVEEKGYVVVEEERPTRPPVPVSPPGPRPVQAPQRNQDKGWSYEEELPKRTKTHPYVIHQDEFNTEGNEYTQLTWTYYAADNILVDENDEVVVRPELTVGEENLKRFGHGSDDENVVFVRNDRIEIEWEICRTLKSYEVEILGLDRSESGTEDDETTGA